MGAGPSRARVTRAIRESLYAARRTYGGEYIKGTPQSYASLRGDNWIIMPRLLRASNGEACLQWLAQHSARNGQEAIKELSLDLAAKRAGILPKVPA